jgi:hypothetical protein
VDQDGRVLDHLPADAAGIGTPSPPGSSNLLALRLVQYAVLRQTFGVADQLSNRFEAL